LETGDGGAYRVRLRAASPTGEWGDTADVSPPDHNHYHFSPDVAAAGGRAWIVWNGSSRWGLLNHRFNHMRTLHAALAYRDDTGAVTVEPAPGETPMGFAAGQLPIASLPFLHMLEEEFVTPQAPRVRLAPATPGSVADWPVVFFRRFRSTTLKDFGWTLDVMRHTGAGWTPPEPVSSSAGFPDAPYGVLADGASWMLAYHSGEYPEAPDRNPSCAVRGHRLAVERVTLAPAPTRQPARVTDRRPRDKEWVASPARVAHSVPVSTVETDGGPLHLLYGDLHRHSVYSKCMSANDGDPLDHWRWVQDVAPLDFYALTEHLEYMSALEWRRVQDLAQRIASGGHVLALCGFELVLPPGHTNFFYADDAVGHDLRVACLTSATLEEVWPKLDAWIPEGTVVAIRHSQGHRGDEVPRSYAPRWEPVAEIVQTRGDYTAWVHGLWKHGMKLGVVGASDHARGAPFVQCITGLWVPPGDRTREGVLSGLRARRTFATNGPRMSVWLTVRGDAGAETLLMGDEGRVSGLPRLTIEVSGTRALETVELFRDEALIARWTPGEAHASLEHTDAAAPPGEHAYWVRTTQGQEKVGRRPVRGLAYSSPVWVTL
jgi:hypothetical protein